MARFVCLFAAIALFFMWLTPLIFPAKAGATGQLSQRSLTLGSAQPGVSTTYKFTFYNVSTTPIKGLKFIACTTAFGTYGGGNTCQGTATAPTGLSFSAGPASFASQNGFQDSSSLFARDATGNTYCTPSANVLCASRSSATTNETTNTPHDITFSGVVNPSLSSNNGVTFYVGVYTYDAITSSTPLDSGTTAAAVVQTLTVSAQVAEVLQFCVGATSVNDATSNPGSDCSAISGNAVNLGTLDSSQINTSPWNTDGGSNTNGVALVRSNAANGTTVSYDAIPSTNVSNGDTDHLGTLRLDGVDCDATATFTDGCINAAGPNQAIFTAGQEKFGMTIAGINCGSNGGATISYNCDYSSGATNLAPQANYIGGTYVQGTSGTFGTGSGFAWQEDGSAVAIASSSSSPIKQIDDEAIILSFAATPSITTPFGSYSVKVDFVAVPTY